MERLQLRNPELYRRLRRWSVNNVRVHKPGEAGEFAPEEIRERHYKKLRLSKSGTRAGEEFSVCCPECNDTKFRLYFNHLWGTADPYSGSQILWLCHCYNEECQNDFNNRRQWAEDILGDGDTVLRIQKDVVVEPPKTEISLPGEVIPIKQLALQNMSHPAVQFCMNRGYRINELDSQNGVLYCVQSRVYGGAITGRIVAPWYFRKPNGESRLGGWTARKHINVEGDDTSKWMHSWAPTQDVVYGLSEAVRYRVIVIVEGPGDKWSVGPNACAILGKTLTDRKAKQIVQACRGIPRVFVVALDPDQDNRERVKGKKHHIENAVAVMKSVTSDPVVGLYLPPTTDPGGLDRDYFWSYASMTFPDLNLDAAVAV
jgi:putative hemolysin